MPKFLQMTTNRTFTMIKPDAVEKGHIGAILEKINSAGFKIVAMKFTQLSKRDAEKFYEIQGFKVHRLKNLENQTDNKIIRIIKNYIEFFKLWKILKKKKFDLLHIIGQTNLTASAITYASLNKIPMIIELVTNIDLILSMYHRSRISKSATIPDALRIEFFVLRTCQMAALEEACNQMLDLIINVQDPI